MANDLEDLEIKISSDASESVKNIEALAASLNKLKESITAPANKMSKLADGLNNVVSALNGVDTTKVDKFVASFQGLEAASKIKISKTFVNNLNDMTTAMSGITDDSLDRIDRLCASLQRLSGVELKGFGSAIRSAASVGAGVSDNQLFSTTVKADTASYRADSALTKVGVGASDELVDLAVQLDNAKESLREMTAELQDMSEISSVDEIAEMTAQVKSQTKTVNELTARLNAAATAEKNIAKAADMATEEIKEENESLIDSVLNAGTLITITQKLGTVLASAMKSANEYVENMNLAQAVMQSTFEGEYNRAWSLYETLGIDPAEFIRYEGVFNALASGMGIASESADIMSRNLTQLGYDISSFFNLDVEDAMLKVQSALSGELEPLRRIGWDVSVSRIQTDAAKIGELAEEAAAKSNNLGVAISNLADNLDDDSLANTAVEAGITKTVNSMTQAEKAQLRYYEIMTQLTEVHGDLARTIMSPANMLRVFSANINMITREIGFLVQAVMGGLLPVLIAVAQVIYEALSAFRTALGIEAFTADFSDMQESVAGVGTAAEDTAGSAKEMKKQLMGFDQINNITQSSSGGSGGSDGGGSDFDISDLLKQLEYDMTVGAMTEQIEKLKGTIRTIATATKIGFEAAAIINYAKWAATTDKKLGIVGKTAASVFSKSKTFLSALSRELRGEQFVAGSAKTLAILEKIAPVIERIKTVFAPLATAISKIIEVVKGSAILKFLTDIGGKLGEIITKIPLIGPLIKGIGGKFIPIVGEVLMVVDAIHLVGGALTWATSTAKSDVELLSGVCDKTAEEVGGIVDGIFDIANTAKMTEVLGEVISEEDKNSAISKITEVEQAILDKLDQKRNADLAGLNLLEGILPQEKIEEAKNNINNFYDGIEKDVVKFSQTSINAYQNMVDEQGRLTDEGYAEIQAAMEGFNSVILTLSGATEEDLLNLQRNYQNKSLEEQKAAVSKTLQQAAYQRDERISYINEQYDQMLSTLRSSLAGASESEKAYWQEQIASAENQRDALINNANETYDGVYDSVTEKLPQVKDYIDKKTGEITTNWGAVTSYLARSWDNGLDGMSNSATRSVDEIKDELESIQDAKVSLPKINGEYRGQPSGSSLLSVIGGVFEKFSVGLYAAGGLPDMGELFVAREAGPELVGRIGSHNAVANNEQITQGIASAVVNALQIYMPYLQDIASSSRTTANKELSVSLNGNQLANAINNSARVQGRPLITV